ncbi:unnamed protein product [Phyllotreta striolata]|uniref:Cupin-like domain-containing protein n=1 Tax=Phyllotreta striolata TaxID=444603 RepID=A0A9N9XUY9_PHYSR|nr:unnamed protein product [Phyllotreta striolata]
MSGKSHSISLALHFLRSPGVSDKTFSGGSFLQEIVQWQFALRATNMLGKTLDVSLAKRAGKYFNKKLLFLYKREIKVCFYAVVFCCVLHRNAYLFYHSECVVEMPVDASKVFKEPENCAFCENITTVEKISRISPTDFYQKYTKRGKPVVITDATQDWPAIQSFTFDFFKTLYESTDNAGENCQFFPYRTEFRSLAEVFRMPAARAALAPGERPWYVGWNNCRDEAGRLLRRYYSAPYFLGDASEGIRTSWIFMGGPGPGAQMHIDNVHYPSWQAQLSGRKLWKLAPPLECWSVCHAMEVEVETGETIVVDTNRWYHQTIVLPGRISITIGSEFD